MDPETREPLAIDEPSRATTILKEGKPGFLRVGLAVFTLCIVIAVCVIVGIAVHRHNEEDKRDQHFWIMRHGDKLISYPPCDNETAPPCYDKENMQNNPPLSPCGIQQANHTAHWVMQESQKTGGIQHIMSSPWARCLMTSLPLVRLLDFKLKVDPLLSEAYQEDGPFRAHNPEAQGDTPAQLEEISLHWDLDYGAPPIPMPENTRPRYGARVMKAAEVIKRRFLGKGNVAIYTHASVSFSVAYGLCHEGDGTKGDQLQKFVEGQAPIGPAGVIHVVFDKSGKCKIEQTNNVAEGVECGNRTPPHRCDYKACPDWHWPGHGDGHCDCS